jgi:sugar phosphate isomerase/epimerase
LDANLTLASSLGCGWIIGHGGYHFGDLPQRRQAAVERIKRLVAKAERKEVVIFFENHNKEPELAELHYLPHNIEEMQWFFDTIQSPHFKWAFNVAHAHLVPEDWGGFLDAFGGDNIGQVRLNDNKGDHEVHLIPGEGNIDFSALFSRLKKLGYTGWFSLDFESESDILRVKDWFETLI